MDSLSIAVDGPEEYDEIIRNSLPDDGVLRVVTKACGTVGDKSVAVMTFGVMIDGKIERVQIVKSVKLLAGLFGVLNDIAEQER